MLATVLSATLYGLEGRVIRVEADASGWRQSVTLAALIAGLATCGLLGIPLAMLLSLQRERVQSAVIRNRLASG